jgi:hypothetical protein
LPEITKIQKHENNRIEINRLSKQSVDIKGNTDNKSLSVKSEINSLIVFFFNLE